DPNPIEARIVALDARVDPVTRNALVRARISRRAPAPGASVRVEVPVGPATPVVAIPVSALRKGPGGDHVFVVEPDSTGHTRVHEQPVQQYPKIESSSVVITTVYYGASAEAVRGFLTTPIERAVSAIGGVDYVESSSRAGLSTITVHLKLNHSTTAALAEVTARLQQVRSELPAEAQPPMVEVQKADRPYASFYLSFTSSAREIPALTDWLT